GCLSPSRCSSPRPRADRTVETQEAARHSQDAGRLRSQAHRGTRLGRFIPRAARGGGYGRPGEATAGYLTVCLTVSWPLRIVPRRCARLATVLSWVTMTIVRP